ncbi:MAG: hypothetical protein K8T90_21805 [Planctomycetes bacterium]|nr:hypothetical protein [Planctomycetota bacterium]
MCLQRPVARLVQFGVVGAALLAVASAAPAAKDELAVASGRRLATLRASLRADTAIFAGAVRSTLADLRAGRTTDAAAAATYASALTFLIRKADTATDTAAGGFLADVVDALLGDPAGVLAGDGRSIDGFVAGVRSELGRARAAAAGKSRLFARSFVRTAGGTSGMTTVLPDWVFDLPGAPTPTGIVAIGDEPVRLRMITAARLPDGRLIVSACGTAGPAFDGAFDLRLRGAAVDVIPSALSAGGIPVSSSGNGTGGTWSVAAELGDPFHGNVPIRGNRVVQFGTEPFDGGPAGRQPGRLVFATVLGVP